MDVVELIDFADEFDDSHDQERDIIGRPIIDRNNPFEIYDDNKFMLRYRFKKETVLEIIKNAEGVLERATKRNNSLSVDTQVSCHKFVY